MSRLDGKVILAVGATSTIGQEMVEHFVREGARVVLTGRTIEQVKEIAAKYGDRAVGVQLDVTDRTAATEAVHMAMNLWQRVDGLVYLAGVGEPMMAEVATEKNWDLHFDVNVKGAFLVSQAVFPVMKEQGTGSILYLSSIFSKVGGPGLVAYSSSKGALQMLAKSLAVEWAQHGICVNCIAPGYILTELNQRGLEENPEMLEYILYRTPLNQLCQASDVAQAAVYLLAEGSRHMTGQDIVLDGGWLA